MIPNSNVYTMSYRSYCSIPQVYTVNNESVYLVIQGVPSVGAGGELNKLCSSFGSVEDFRPLDEYPCEDKYTEVYLIKYKKIQSSR